MIKKFLTLHHRNFKKNSLSIQYFFDLNLEMFKTKKPAIRKLQASYIQEFTFFYQPFDHFNDPFNILIRQCRTRRKT